MNVLLDPPETVYCLAAESSVRREMAAALSECPADELVRNADPAAVRDAVDAGDCACVVVHDSLGSERVVDLCERLDDADPLLPVVVWIDGDAELTTEATVAGADATLLAPDDEQVAAVVTRALERSVDRRTEAEESEILNAMLTDLETALYAKDTEARHLKIADVRGGADPEEAIGKTDPELYDDDPRFAREAYEDDMTVLESETPVFNRDERHGEAGSEHWSRTTKVPWYDGDGRLKGLVGVSHDITELKEKETRLEEVRDRFEQFAQHLSHDLQNPLQVASGYLEMARTTGETEPLAEVADALDRMEEMIDDMSRVASHRGAGEGNPTRFHLADLVESVWSHLSTRDATVRIELPDDYVVHAEKAELRPLFENLLKNAVEHGSRGDTAVTVTVGLTEDGGLFVADDGPGFPNLSGPATLDTVADDSGTGLRIVENVATRNDWTVTVTESAAGGARFGIRNCLGAPDRTPAGTLGRLELTETANVGDTREPGRVDYDPEADEWIVAGDGEDIYRQYNDFKFAYVETEGPVRIQGRIVDLDHVAEFTKAGLMIRDDRSADATYGYVGATPGRGTEFLWRTERGTDGTSQQLSAEPFEVDWFRIDRVGDRLTASISTDGENWDAVDERRLAISDPVSVGLAVCSVVPGVLAEATFSDVSVRRLDA